MLGQLEEQTRWALEAKAEDSQEEREPEAICSVQRDTKDGAPACAFPTRTLLAALETRGKTGLSQTQGERTNAEAPTRRQAAAA